MGSPRFRFNVVIGLVALTLVASLAGRPYAQDLESAIAAHARHTDWLMRFPNVVGTAVGLAADGQPAIKVYTRAAGAGGIPDRLEGLPIVVEVTGEIFALNASSAKGKGGGSGGSGLTSPCTTNPPPGLTTTSLWPPPVPIGVSTGNSAQCLAGTIGARIADQTNIYALSNNHVYAEESTGNPPPQAGLTAVQPGLYDTNCTLSSTTNNTIGPLSAYVPLSFNCTCFIFCACSGTDNQVDAAIASTMSTPLCAATPSNGYGYPVAGAGISACLNEGVQKYGRTTSLTQGTVSGISATVIVNYGNGNYARFVNQVQVSASKAFIKPGDSGSLLVATGIAPTTCGSVPAKAPIGLLFAGNSSGTAAFANPIGEVLTELQTALGGGVTLTITGQ